MTAARLREQRVADVRRLLAAAGRVFDHRSRIAAAIAGATGLSPEGVELGFASLERDASAEELAALVARAGSTPHVHVVLSATVFVASLRAIAVARAAADRVTVRPSPRDPVLAEALVREAGDDAIRIVSERDVEAIDCTEVHVYGRDETLGAVRSRVRAGVRVRAHGAGLGVVVVGEHADLARAAELVAPDVAAFDQRGCLSPRVVVALGDEARTERLAEALHATLTGWGVRVPRGALGAGERAEAARWQETMRFAGRLRAGGEHAVATAAALSALAVPPPGRHVLVVPAGDRGAAGRLLAPIARFVVTVGSDEPDRAREVVSGRVRVAELGRMQRPPLDGPVDLREPGVDPC